MVRFYKEIRVCRGCRERFVVKDKNKSYYCSKCQKKFTEYKSQQ